MGKFLYALWLIRPTIGKLQILHTIGYMSIYVKFETCQMWGACFICSGVQAKFLPQILHTRSPTVPI